MNPNFALLLLLNTNKEVLLLRRINTPFSSGYYSLPGGKIELGESAIKTIIREAKNSLGLETTDKNIKCVHVMHRKCNDPEFFSCVFRLTCLESKPVNHEPDRHDDMQWFTLDNLPANIIPAHHHAINMIQKNIFYSEHGW